MTRATVSQRLSLGLSLVLAVTSVTALVLTVVPATAGPACPNRIDGDFDGDGHADVVIGEPYRDVGSGGFCGTCGAGHGGGRFRTNCGASIPTP